MTTMTLRVLLLCISLSILTLVLLPHVLTAEATPTPLDAGPPSFNHEIFRRKDLIYGTTLGSWPFHGQGYDGHPLIQNPGCQQLAQEARISVVRWMPRQPFEDMGGNLSDEAFNNVIDGIRGIGALSLIVLPPGVHHHCTPTADLTWLTEIVTRAGDRVILYEFTNESNYYCDWSAEQYTQEWIRVVPQLKQHARALGFEIYIGGPSWSYPSLSAMQTFLQGVKTEYDRTGDDDLIPSFVSFHTFPSHHHTDPDEVILSRIPAYGDFISTLHDESRHIFGFEFPVADTEWNFTTNSAETRDQDEAFMTAFTQGMLREFREHGAWLANQFAFASEPEGGVLDMVDTDCNPKPMYAAFREFSTSDKPFAVYLPVITRAVR